MFSGACLLGRKNEKIWHCNIFCIRFSPKKIAYKMSGKNIKLLNVLRISDGKNAAKWVKCRKSNQLQRILDTGHSGRYRSLFDSIFHYYFLFRLKYKSLLLYYKILIDIRLLWTRPIQRTSFAQSSAMFNTLLAIAKLIEFSVVLNSMKTNWVDMILWKEK